MENTQSARFENDQPEWFVAIQSEGTNKVRGPLKAEEVAKLLEAKTLAWVDFIYREKDGNWIRACDHEMFKGLLNTAPAVRPVMKTEPKMMVPPPPPAPVKEVQWFLYQNEKQTGPYSTSDLKQMVALGQVTSSAFVWQEEFSEWVSIANAGLQTAQVETKKDLRSAPRKALEAQVYATNQSALVSGICRDISVGGMQVVTDQVPVQVGSTIRINVAPTANGTLKPFVAEGVVVRILDNQKGFSYRFTGLSEDAKQSIQSYLSA